MRTRSSFWSCGSNREGRGGGAGSERTGGRDSGGSPRAIAYTSLGQSRCAHTRQFNRVPIGAISELRGVRRLEDGGVPLPNLFKTSVITLEIQGS